MYESSSKKDRVVAILLAISAQGKSRRHRGAGRVGEWTAEGSRLGLRPAGSDAGAADTTIQQAIVICMPFEGNIIIRVRYSYYITRGRLVCGRGTKSVFCT